ncbi:MAG: hypothetical protein AABX38_05085 [Candidatus Micrarchaeota archaeon]
MHNKRKKLRYAPVPSAELSHPKKWRKWALLGGIALGLYIASKITPEESKNPRGQLVVARKIGEEKKFTNIHNILDRYSISNSEVKKIIQTSDYDIVILSQNSNALKRISAQNLNGASLALIKEGSQIRCFLVVRPFRDDEIIPRYDVNADKIKQNLKDLLDKTARSSSPDDRALLFEQTMQLAKTLSSREPDREILEFMLLQELLQIRVDDAQNIEQKRKNNFSDTLLHEVVHGEYSRNELINHPEKYSLGNNDVLILGSATVSVLTIEDSEKLARLATIAYGVSPISMIRDLISRSSLELISSPKRDSYKLLKDLLFALNVSKDHLALLDKTEDEIRFAAKQLLERFSIERYGTPFDQVISPTRLESVLWTARNYFDQNQGNL